MTRTTLREAALMSLASAFAGAINNGDRNKHAAAKNRMNLVMAENGNISGVPARDVLPTGQAEYWRHRGQA
jgi:hypothetical protein